MTFMIFEEFHITISLISLAWQQNQISSSSCLTVFSSSLSLKVFYFSLLQAVCFFEKPVSSLGFLASFSIDVSLCQDGKSSSFDSRTVLGCLLAKRLELFFFRLTNRLGALDSNRALSLIGIGFISISLMNLSVKNSIQIFRSRFAFKLNKLRKLLLYDQYLVKQISGQN